MSTYEGHCHCGQTAWTAKLEPDQANHVLCHCDVCKVISGSAWTMNQIIPRSALQFTKGGEELKKYTYYGESGNAVDCFYCPNCTAHPYHHQHVLGPDTIILRTSLLDKSRDLPVAAEIFGKRKFGWEKEVAETFETMPPS